MNKYPHLWKRGIIQERVRERANHQCEQCGMQFIAGSNIAIDAVNRCGNPIIGTVHHIDSDRSNNLNSNLVYLCQCCHLRIHGWGWKPGRLFQPRWGDIPPWIIARGLHYRIQHNLFEREGA